LINSFHFQSGGFRLRLRGLQLLMAGWFLLATLAGAQQPPEHFQWLNLHEDRSVLPLVTKALQHYSFHSLREVGLFYDQALAVVSERKAGASLPSDDRYVVYSVNLTSGAVDQLLIGYDLKWVAWQPLEASSDSELLATYTDCVNCSQTLYVTSFHISRKTHEWQARWSGDQTPAPLTSKAADPAVNSQYVYALLGNAIGGGSVIATWSHTEPMADAPQKKHVKKQGEAKQEGAVQDRLYLYQPEPQSDMGVAQPVHEREAPELEKRLCLLEDGNPLHGGQDSALCKKIIDAQKASARKPNTAPPVQNQGRMNLPRK
jgi:hypothetical protein